MAHVARACEYVLRHCGAVGWKGNRYKTWACTISSELTMTMLKLERDSVSVKELERRTLWTGLLDT